MFLSRLIKIVFYVSLSSCSLLPYKSQTLPENRLLQAACTIVDFNSKIIRNYPFSNCLFQSDGSWVGIDQKKIYFFDPNNNIKIEHEINPHHTILQASNKDVLVFGSTLLTLEEKTQQLLKFNLREDVIYRFSKDGVLLNKLNLNLLRNEIFKHNNYYTVLRILPFNENPTPEIEYTHANSIFEIKNAQELLNSQTIPGDLLINVAIDQSALLVDSNLTHIKKYFYQVNGFMHDLQVTPEGKLLSFVNSGFGLYSQSSIQKFNSDFSNSQIIYKRDTPLFHNAFAGSVEFLEGDQILISELQNTTYTYARIINLKTGKESLPAEKFFKSNKMPIFSIKNFTNLDFLKMNKGI